MSQSLDLDLLALQSALAGQFSIERELGRGGMGMVYLAREVQLERPVAIKVLPPALAARPELRERFLREARTSAGLSHPNIVPIFRVDDLGGFVFFVMAFVDGETIGQRVRTRGPLPPHTAARLIQEIAWALAYAHARGVVHRDIKPDNILIDAASGRAMVTDFGIAQQAKATSLTDQGQVMGTAHFMSPEQAAGEPLDGRSDLYSLGVVSFYALTAKFPFDGPTVQAILAKHLTQPAPPVATVNPAVPRALGQVIDRCLAKDVAARFATGEAVAEALTNAQGERRTTPVPLRVWLAKGEAAPRLYAVWMIGVGVQFIARLSPWTPLVLAVPFVAHAGYELYQTRLVFEAGYSLDDLRAALHEYNERRSEELAFEYARVSIIGRLERVSTYAALAVAAGSAAMIYLAPEAIGLRHLYAVFYGSAAAAAFGAFVGMKYPGRRIKKRYYLSELRARFWNSRFGERFTRLARWRLTPSEDAAPLAPRPTEVIIGLAAADLFAALPKAQQAEVAQLPETVRQLETEAHAMRKRVAELTDALTSLDGADPANRSAVLARFGDGAGIEVRREQVAADVRAARDAAGKRLGDTVAALENIRLDLLRLQAGAGSVRQLTAALDAARLIGSNIDAAVADRVGSGVAVHDG